MEAALNTIRKWLVTPIMYFATVARPFRASCYCSSQGSQLSNAMDHFSPLVWLLRTVQALWELASKDEAPKLIRAWFLYGLQLKSVVSSSAVGSHHRVLETNQEQSQQPVIFWGIYGNPLTNILKEITHFLHWGFYLLTYGIWERHCPPTPYRVTPFKLFLYMYMA